MENKQDILSKIIERKKHRVAQQKLLVDIEILKEKIHSHHVPPLRGFKKTIENHLSKYNIAIIAELKKASPSKGLLTQDYNPVKTALAYARHGAACLSILTEQDFFYGDILHLEEARNNCILPILRKDFIIDPYQIFESRIIGADCILLIAAILSPSQLKEFYELANTLGLDILIEVHNEQELDTALQIEAKLIGINNRNLTDFSINLQTTIELANAIPNDRIVVGESGIHSRADIEKMLSHDIHTFLIGEALMKSPTPGEKLVELLGSKSDNLSL